MVIPNVLRMAMLIYAARAGTYDILQTTQIRLKKNYCFPKQELLSVGVTLFIITEFIRLCYALSFKPSICGIFQRVFQSVLTMEAASLMTINELISQVDESKPDLTNMTKEILRACIKGAVVYFISLGLMLETSYTEFDIYRVLISHMQMIGAVFVGITGTFSIEVNQETQELHIQE